jgi:CHAT domain-containing protein/tetratricopeptide (TPR) repeat protein
MNSVVWSNRTAGSIAVRSMLFVLVVAPAAGASARQGASPENPSLVLPVKVQKTANQDNQAGAQNSDGRKSLASLWVKRGRIAYKRKDYETAINDYRKAIELDTAKIDYPMGLANALVKVGNFLEAREVLTKVLETYSPSLDEAKQLQRLLAGTWKMEGDGLFNQKAYEGAIRCFAEAVRLEPDVFEYVKELGLAYYKAERFEEMGDLAESAIKRFLAPADRHTLSEFLCVAYGKRADAAKEKNDYATAIEWYQKAVSARPDAHQYIIELAAVYITSEKFEAAIQLLQSTLKGFRTGEEHEQQLKILALAYVGWGIQLMDAGRFGEAMKARQEALALCREMKIADNEVKVLNQLGESYCEFGDYANATALHKKALAQCELNQNSDWASKAEAETYLDLGAVYFGLNDYKKAAEYYHRAVEIGQRNNDPNTINRGRAGVAFVLLKEGNIAEAIEALNQVLTLAQQQNDRVTQADILGALGCAEFWQKDYVKATEYLSQELAIDKERDSVSSQATVLANLMVVWKERNKPELAIFFGKLSVNITQSIRRNMRELDSRLQGGYLASVQGAYRMLADLLVSQGRIAEGEQVLRLLKAKEYQDFIRSETLDAAANTVPLTRNDKEWEQRFNTIQDQVVAIGREYSSLLAKESKSDDDTRRLRELENDLAVNNKALEDLYNEISTRASPRLARDIKDSMQVLMQNLSKIEPGAVVLETIVLEDKYRVILTTPDTQVAGQYLIKREDLRKKVFRFREAMRERTPEAEVKALAQELYAILVGPVAKNIEAYQAKTLVWSLDDVLRYIPMAALYDGSQYLVQRYGNVIITEGSLINLKEKPSADWTALGLGVSKAHRGFVELPNVPGELRAIIRDESGEKTSGVLPGKIMLDDKFTERSLVDALSRRQYRVVHIASHFTISADGNSENSFLLLGEGNLSKLTMSRIATIPNLFSDVELLTLSACDTAMGDYENENPENQGVEFESLGVLAQQKGALSVLASLWEVADASTSLLMREFYRHREEQPGATKAEALQRAQMNLILNGNGKYAHPFYWAPFVLIGNWK